MVNISTRDKAQWISLGIKAAGAAFSSTVIGWIKGALPTGIVGLTDEILTTVIGFVLWSGILIKQEYVNDFGEGMLLAGLSQLIAQMVPQAAGSFAYTNQKQRAMLDKNVRRANEPRTPVLNLAGAY